MARLLVDGVFFQFNNTGIARLWRAVLAELTRAGRHEILFLNRGNAPAIDGVRLIPFRRTAHEQTPEDSAAIETVCRQHSIDVFTSTYYTTPLGTPMVMVVHDMIPELFGYSRDNAAWAGKGLAIGYAQRYLCISERTRGDLLALYPEIAPDRVSMAYCGVDETVFHPRPAEAIGKFRRRNGLTRPYYLMVGTRGEKKGHYKNGRLLFEAVAGLATADFDVVCVGGESGIGADLAQSLPCGVRAHRLKLTDEELACAYGGALALVYPSLYEGFGMPAVEAMASGCPVITTSHGSLAEAAGYSACLVDGLSPGPLREALARVRKPRYARRLREAGLRHAARFRWATMAEAFSVQVDRLIEESRRGEYDAFLREWQRLRMAPANSDSMATPAEETDMSNH